MVLGIWLGLLATLIVAGYLWVKKQFSFWVDRGFVQDVPSFPFGNIKGAGFSVHMSTIMSRIYREHKKKGPIIGMYFFTQPVAVAVDVETIKHILVKDFNNFRDRGIYYNLKTDPLSGHLFALEGNEWKNLRAKLSPTFTSGKMKMMFGTVVQISHELVDFMKNDITSGASHVKEMEMRELLAQFTTDVIGNVAFGLDMNCIKNPNSEFRDMGRKFVNPGSIQTMKTLFVTIFRDFSRKLGLMLTQKDVSEYFMKSIQETVDYREKNNVERNDFMNLLLQIKNHGKISDDKGDSLGTLSFNELAAQCFLFFLAGFETSSTTMTFCLYELAMNVDVQETLRAEILSILAKNDNVLTYENMLEMKYLQMVIDGNFFEPLTTEALI